MNLLAIDTSSIACSVALQIGGATTERHEELPREHTRLLVPMIEALVKESPVELKDLDAIVLGNGPGSFIGAMHRTAARLDDQYEIVAAALSSDAEATT